MLTPRDPAAFRAEVLRRAVRLDRRRKHARRAGAASVVAALLLSGTSVQLARSGGGRADEVGLTATAAPSASPAARAVPLDLPGLRTPWAAVGIGGRSLWVLDRGGEAGPVVRRFDGRRPVATAQLPPDAAPEHLVAGTDGGIWMTDPPRSRALRVGPGGEVATWPTGGRPSATAVYSGERLWFGDRRGGRLRGLGADGTLVDRRLPDGAAPEVVGSGPDGSLWFGDRDRPVLGSVSPSGGTATLTLPAPDQRVLVMAAGPGPSLWLLLGSDSGLRLARVGGGEVVADEVDSSSVARGLTQGPDGSIWFTSGDGALLHRRSLSTALATPLDRPVRARAWALGGDGTVWAVDADRNQVVEVRAP